MAANPDRRGGIVRTCGAAIGGYLLVTLIYVLSFHQLSGDFEESALAGALLAIPGILFYMSLRSLFVPTDEERLIRRFREGAPMQDGEVVAALGELSPSRKPLASPLQRRECVAYEYLIYRHDLDRRKSLRKRAQLRGFARTASAISTPQGEVHLSGFIDLGHFPAQELDPRLACREARRYAQEASFAELTVDATLQDAEELTRSWDGRDELRYDTTRPGAEPNESLYYEERVVPRGAVCAVGRYDMRGPSLRSTVGEPVQLFPGSPEDALRHLRNHRRKAFRFFLVFFLITHVAGIAAVLYA